jgi:multiple sugar transport system ATP-binding protein
LRTTTIFVTHDQVEAMTMAERIVVMQDGRIEQIGSPLELYNHPKNVFVATFIGAPAMNMIHGIARNAGRPAVEANGGQLPVLEDNSLEDGRTVIYGIRPEHLDIAEEGFPARIAVVEPTGPETLLFLRFGESDLVAAFRDRHDFEPGQTVHLLPRADKAHLFDSATGTRI